MLLSMLRCCLFPVALAGGVEPQCRRGDRGHYSSPARPERYDYASRRHRKSRLPSLYHLLSPISDHVCPAPAVDIFEPHEYCT